MPPSIPPSDTKRPENQPTDEMQEAADKAVSALSHDTKQDLKAILSTRVEWHREMRRWVES